MNEEALPIISSRPKTLKSPVKWVGGKTWISGYISDFIAVNPSERFVEPFAGGMAVALKVSLRKALINDINPHLINLYNQIKIGLASNITMEYDSKRYYHYRALFNELILQGNINDRQTALLFFYLNKTCYNGMCRFNKKGGFNVPFGKYTNVNYDLDFGKYKEQFSNWDFTNSDFETLKINQSDFLFVDPPYDDSFTSYSPGGFTWEDQERVATWSAKQDCPVVATNLSTDRIIEMYLDLGFDVRFMKARRSISCVGGKRRPVLEMIAVKNAALPPSYLNNSISSLDDVFN